MRPSPDGTTAPRRTAGVASRSAEAHGGVVLFTDGRDWHLRRLKAAFANRGLQPVIASLRDVVFDTAQRPAVRVPGFDDVLPRAALVRGIAAGSFEAITMRLGVLHALEAAGVAVWNPAGAVERCVDKSATSLIFAARGLPTPATFVTESRARAADFVAAASGSLVLKPLFGAQGKGIRRIDRPEDLPEPEAIGGVYYLQRYIAPADGLFRDYRLFVSGGRVVDAMVRESATWITNVHQGAKPFAYAAPREARELAVAAADSVGATFAGVDLIADGQGGFMVLEVNSMPAWKGLQSVAGVDVADVLVGDVLAAAGLASRPALVAAG